MVVCVYRSGARRRRNGGRRTARAGGAERYGNRRRRGSGAVVAVRRGRRRLGRGRPGGERGRGVREQRPGTVCRRVRAGGRAATAREEKEETVVGASGTAARTAPVGGRPLRFPTSERFGRETTETVTS